MITNYRPRTDLHDAVPYRSLFLLAFLTIFSLGTHATPTVPTGYTEVASAYDNFDNFKVSDYTTNGSWDKQSSGCEIGGNSDWSAYNKTPSTGDYLGKSISLEAGTYQFSYAIKIGKNQETKLILCWDKDNPATYGSPEFTISSKTGGTDPGIDYLSSEFTVTAGTCQN